MTRRTPERKPLGRCLAVQTPEFPCGDMVAMVTPYPSRAHQTVTDTRYSRHMTVTCDGCGKEFTPARSDARYCSGLCRTRAYRERNQLQREPRKRRPITEAFWDQTYDLSKRVESLERLTLDDRFGRNREVLQQQNRKHVTRAIEALQRIEDRLS